MTDQFHRGGTENRRSQLRDLCVLCVSAAESTIARSQGTKLA